MTLQMNNTSFLCGTGSPYYMEKLKKIAKYKISCAKNFISVHIKP